MNTKHDEILRYLKHGRGEALHYYIKEQKKANYPQDFTEFMNQMMDEYHVKKKDVAIRAGLSQDYTYKVLNGAKKTKERDYILAICIVVGMNISQTQHALEIYGMPLLNKADLRSNIIYHGIEGNQSIDRINEWLENAGFVYIKVSPDMPSAKIELRMLNDVVDMEPSAKIIHTYEEVERQIEAEKCGNAPMDYCYWGIITVQDENGNKYYIEAAYSTTGDNFIVLDEVNYKKSIEIIQNESVENTHYYDNYSEPDVLEQYDSLVDASQSVFFKFFLELDHATDKKVEEIMEYIDDTRNYGTRIGAGLIGNQKACYIEAFNRNNPAEREYYQIIQKNGELTYSLSHESYFLRIELGEFYSAYFADRREPEYYLCVKDTKELSGNNLRLRFIFDDLRLAMHQYVREEFGSIFDTDDEFLSGEMITSMIQKATWYMHGGNFQESLDVLLQAIDLMEDAGGKGVNYFVDLAITYSKVATMYEKIGDKESMFNTYDKLYDMKNKIPEIMESASDGVEDALQSLAEAMIYKAQKYQNINSQYDGKAKEIVKDAITLLEGKCTLEESYKILFMAYTKYAYMIDQDEPEQAVRYCRKAVTIVNAYHLDQNPSYQKLVITLYNNYAWVLWNKLGSEEAIIYYGRAIELLEGFLYTKSMDLNYIIDSLKHEGDALYKLYMSTNKDKEANRLRERLAENNIDI